MDNATSNTHAAFSHRLEISKSEIKEGVENTDALETALLIRDISAVRGRLTNELLERLGKDSFFGTLDVSDWEKITGQTRRSRDNMLWLIRACFNAIAASNRVNPLKVSDGWYAIKKRSETLIPKLRKRAKKASDRPINDQPKSAPANPITNDEFNEPRYQRARNLNNR
jgi:hypothetical protein